jgi:quinol monooxygenase YgiN
MAKTKRGNGRLLRSTNANSSQAHQSDPGELLPRVLEAPSDTLTPTLGALQVSGGLRDSHGDADCQTLEDVFEDAAPTTRPYLGKPLEKEKAMFARVVECQAKGGRGVQISTKVTSDVLPILQKQPGFVDFLALSDKTNAERLVCISFWTSREDAEEYHRQHYDTITNILKPVLESAPTLKTFTVSASTAHRIAVGRAA